MKAPCPSCDLPGPAVKLTPRVGKPRWGCGNCRAIWPRPDFTLTQGAQA